MRIAKLRSILASPIDCGQFESASYEVTPMKRIDFAGICKIGLVALIVGAAIGMAGVDAARAQGPYCGGWGCGSNFPYGLYGNRVNDVPYFSMFPPVYYSVPIPRTYGWSPFAYPPGTMTPEVEPANPQDLINPYVPQKDENNKESKPAKPTSTRTASYHAPTPQVLINPYVHSSKVAAASSQHATDIQ